MSQSCSDYSCTQTHMSPAVISSQTEMQTVSAAKTVNHGPVQSVHLQRLSRTKTLSIKFHNDAWCKSSI